MLKDRKYTKYELVSALTQRAKQLFAGDDPRVETKHSEKLSYIALKEYMQGLLDIESLLNEAKMIYTDQAVAFEDDEDDDNYAFDANEEDKQ
ncbi:DNA-directed RNA polymerase subunit omega [Candidatus Nesciobacter abundans]|uniref:DNA-directed RNA polymerase subunit omega n=1 Tax=Candidatus Nesciobacter abundans TaxID=2601668 RepID=A0A5C0UHN9_9PROT|nr:DNA-directed RNA polymerase subunit omega [Candidatus Nesciobacter abundans]QEK39299.1 DNA-directed RNA polymerase subunit omega [Candidatus Nesciobacter abundans]